MACPCALRPSTEVGMLTPNLFECAARHAVMSCCSASGGGRPRLHVGASPSWPCQVYVTPVSRLIYVRVCPAGTAQSTMYFITVLRVDGSASNQFRKVSESRPLTDNPFTDKPLTDRPLTDNPFTD